jgi:hypothetical protein
MNKKKLSSFLIYTLMFTVILLLFGIGVLVLHYPVNQKDQIGNVSECTLQRVSPLEGIHCVIYEEKIYCNLFEYMGGDGGE